MSDVEQSESVEITPSTQKNVLSLVTIVVFTRSHSEFAVRHADFWSGKEPTLLILDNGDRRWDDETISRHTSNVHYFHDPGGYYRQMKMAADFVTTKYAVLIDDDNMLVPEGLEACILSLQANDELIAVMGQAAVMRYWRGRVILEPCYSQNLNFSNTSNNIQERIWNKLNPYRTTGWYAVQRSQVFRSLLHMVSNVSEESSCPYVAELSLEMGLVLLGSTTTIPNLTVLRSTENPPEDEHLRRMTFQSWWLQKEFRNGHVKVIQALMELVARKSDLLTITLIQEFSRYSLATGNKRISMPTKPTPEGLDHKFLNSQIFRFLISGTKEMSRKGRLLFRIFAASVTRNHGVKNFIGLSSPRNSKVKASADLLEMTPGLKGVILAVQDFYRVPINERRD